MKKWTLVLGGGAARGLAHIGVLKVLEAEGLVPSAILGTSMGAVVGALYAAGLSARHLESLALSLKPLDLLQRFLRFPGLQGLLDSRHIETFVREVASVHRLEECRIPVAVTTVSLHRAEEWVLTRGDLARAVRASSAIPGVFSPVPYGSDFLVDGGVLDPVPVRAAHRLGHEPFVAVNVLGRPREAPVVRHLAEDTEEPVRSFSLLRWLRSGERNRVVGLSLMLDALLVMQQGMIAEALRLHPPVVLLEPEVAHLRGYDFHRAAEAIQAGEAEARRHLARLRKLAEG